MIFFRNFGIFLITYFGIYLVYNLEHFGIFYSANLATLFIVCIELFYDLLSIQCADLRNLETGA